MSDRKEWLEQQIVELETREMFVDLGKIEKVFLGGYRDELKIIELKEKGLWREL